MSVAQITTGSSLSPSIPKFFYNGQISPENKSTKHVKAHSITCSACRDVNLKKSSIWSLSILHYPPSPECQQPQHPHPTPTNWPSRHGLGHYQKVLKVTRLAPFCYRYFWRLATLGGHYFWMAKTCTPCGHFRK